MNWTTGRVEKIERREAKNGNPFLSVVIQAEGGAHKFALFGSAMESIKIRAIDAGDWVRFIATKDGEYENLERIEKLKEAPSAEEKDKILHAISEQDMRIARSTAVKAVAVMVGGGAFPMDVFFKECEHVVAYILRGRKVEE